jgi:hypothetical protein
LGREKVLTIEMKEMTSIVAFRPASHEDGAVISELYRDAYQPVGGGEARDFYPYPQLLVSEEVKGMIRSGGVRWFVAELDGAVIGACGAVLNVGSPEDKIAEAFGLVMKEDYRYCGYGTELFASLDDFLTRREESMFIIAETRTAHPGGWKVVRRHNFIALGFEPAAHLTPAGNESMLLVGKVSSRALGLRKPPTVGSISVQRLSLAVLDQLQGARPPLENDEFLNSQAAPSESGCHDEKAGVNIMENTYDEHMILNMCGRLIPLPHQCDLAI